MLSFMKTVATALLSTAALTGAMPVTAPELAPRQAMFGCQILTAAPLGFNVSTAGMSPQFYLKPSNVFNNGTQIEPTNSPDKLFYAYNCTASNPTAEEESESSVWEVFVTSAPNVNQCLTVDTQKTDGVHLTLQHCNLEYKTIFPMQRFQLALNSFYQQYFLTYLGDNHAPYPTAKQIGVTYQSPGYSFEPHGPFGNGSTTVHYNPSFKGAVNVTLAMNRFWQTNTTWSP